MNIELKIEKTRAEIAKAKARGADLTELKALEKRLNDLWIRLMRLK